MHSRVAGISSGGHTATPTIAFISQGTSNSWAAQLDAVAKKAAAADGAKLVYYNGQGDATKRLPEISAAAATHPDAIVLVPLGAAADTGPVERAFSSGIPVILCDSTVNSTKYTSLVSPNPATAAVPIAQWLADKMGHKGNLLYVGGLPGNTTTILYDQGFNKVMKKYPNIHVINAGNANYSISTAKQLAATAIAKGTKFGGSWGVGGEAVTGSSRRTPTRTCGRFRRTPARRRRTALCVLRFRTTSRRRCCSSRPRTPRSASTQL